MTAQGKRDFTLVTVPGSIYKNALYQKVRPAQERKERGPSEHPLDEADLTIIRSLTRNSRASLSDIAKTLGIGTSTVHKRLSRLVEEGVIRQFTILADNGKIGLGATAFVGIRCEKNKKVDVEKALLEINEIVEIHEVLEQHDFLVKVRSPDIRALKDGPLSRLISIDGVSGVEPVLAVNTIKEVTYNI